MQGVLCNAIADCNTYDAVDNQWTSFTSMNFVRQAFGLFKVAGRIYAIAGRGSGLTSLVSIEFYDGNAWNSQLYSLLNATAYFSGAAIGTS